MVSSTSSTVLGMGVPSIAASCVGDQDIILDPDTSEIQVGFDLIVINELFKLLLPFPLVDQGRDEITSGFIGHYKSGFQFTSHPQVGQSKLIASLQIGLVYPTWFSPRPSISCTSSPII